ncbi:H(+)/Cl(-) exchange transporter 6-like [Convolutriloba macropyga]|uniref:H(+)/Cl(-) exchange transporter 6-like n=1 Tax=Convolutriloba macropyga TaxID=536237 RepID=UPI003F524124
MFVIGFLTAMVGLAIDYTVDKLMDWKFNTAQDSVDREELSGKLALSLLVMMGFNVGFVFLATFLTCFEPYAAGSGIPEVKCYLNGIKMPNITRLKTLLVKAIGVLFSVAGGIFVGREGPMIHSGAVIAAGVPQFMLPQECYEKSEKCAKCKTKGYRHFRSDRQKRDFVSAGAAAGVAAAFGAPIGGVLFSLEEGSSFWNQALTWKSLACAMTSTAVLNFFLSGLEHNDWRSFDNPGLLNFGSFNCTTDSNEDCTLWSVQDLFIFILMGMLGGLLGAVFNQLNYYLTRWRILHVIPKGKPVRAMEAVLVAAVTTILTFTASMTLGTCQSSSSFGSGGASEDDTVTRDFFCNHSEFNDMATLFFNGQETSIKALFHTTDEFSLRTLVIFFVIFFFVACWTYGILVPSGLFVPSILTGAVYGRIWGNILTKWGYNTTLYPGSFALIGSAAFVGGVVRMTISLTVILIETTNEITYGLPIMVTLLAAKFVGDLFNIGLYDIHNEMKGIPFLEWDAPEGMESLEAKDIMSSRLLCVLPHSTVEHVIALLGDKSYHNAFPVVTPDNVRQDKEEMQVIEKLSLGLATENLKFRRSSVLESTQKHTKPSLTVQDPSQSAGADGTHQFRTLPGTDNPNLIKERYNDIKSNPVEPMNKVRFHGIITRAQLVTLLKNNINYKSDQGPASQRELDHWQMIEDYPRYPKLEDIPLDNIDRTAVMDLTPYMKSSPYMVSPHMVVPKIFNFFRTMGLRHLPVVNSIGEIVGIITRSDLTHQALLHTLSHKLSNIATSPN